MSEKTINYLNKAINDLLDIASHIDFNSQDAYLRLGNQTANLCIQYEPKLTELQRSILNEQRTNLLIKAMLGNV